MLLGVIRLETYNFFAAFREPGRTKLQIVASGITRFHVRYYAALLTQQQANGDLGSLSQSLLSSTVDINPHQIDAALFAFSSPLSKGVVLADEVGLGKTIEAGLVICQYWTTGKRKIIIVCPASLRKQWSFELTEKFGIASEILDAKTYTAYFISDIAEEEESIEEPTLWDKDDVINIPKLKAEIALLHSFIDKAKQIRNESKANALLAALKESFKIQSESGAKRKALIFTESTKTQAFLREHLEANGYQGKIVLFNGKASEPQTNEIYRNWCDRHPDKVSGIMADDRRAAIVDYFEHNAEIMIATEAASEGLNLQFCSFVINYDLPWNPQRIEQRIGRCHRYGQNEEYVKTLFG